MAIAINIRYQNRKLLLLWILLLCLSLCAYIINLFFYQYKGNNYFLNGFWSVGLSLILMVSGSILLFKEHNPITKRITEILVFYLVIAALAFATNVVQLTPFPPIDRAIITVENFLGFNLTRVVAWSLHYPLLRALLGLCYDTLPYQLSILPLVIIAAGAYNKIRLFETRLLLSAIIGFTIYYFFPTIGPATALQSPVFASQQFATGLKFFQIHHYQNVTTMDGGMIAMPSFHAIWAWYCLELVKGWPIALILLSTINFLLILACVFLGWHYPADLLVSFFLIFIVNKLTQDKTV